MSSIAARRGALAALTALLGACMSPPDGARVHLGRHVTLYEDLAAAPICPGSLADADHFLEHTARYLGVEPGVYEFYYRAEVPFFVCGGRDGCAQAYGDRVTSASWVHHHELLHLLADTNGPNLLAEGVPVALEPRYFGPDMISAAQREPIESALDSATFRTDGDRETRLYDAGGVFVRYLMSRFGPGPVLAWMHSTPRLVDAVVVAQRFSDAFGRRLTDVLAEFRASGPEPMYAPPQGLRWASCDAEEGVPLADLTGPQHTTLVPCASSRSLALDGMQHAGVDIPEAGLYSLRVEDPRTVMATLLSCDEDASQEAELRRLTGGYGAYEPELRDLPAGRTMLVMAARLPDAGVIEVPWELAHVGRSDGVVCEEAPLVDVPAGTPAIRYVGRPEQWAAPSGTPVTRLRLRFPADVRLRIVRSEGRMVSATFEGCEGCDGSNCGPLGLNVSWVIPADTVLQLVITAEEGATRVQFRIELEPF